MLTHPWFGAETFPAWDLPASAVREVVQREVRNTGVPPREALPAAPFVVPTASYRELFRAAALLVGLAKRAVLYAGRNTSERLRYYGEEAKDYPLFMEDPFVEELFCDAAVRPDVVIGPKGPQFLELNPSGAVSGPVELHCLLRAFKQLNRRTQPELFTSDDPFQGRANLFDDVCRQMDLERKLAWVGSTLDLKHTESTRFFDLEVEFLHQNGFAAEFIEPDRLLDALGLPGRPRYPAGLRYFTTVEWDELGIDLSPIRQALDAGCLLLPTQTASFLDNKKTLAMLSEGQPWMSDAEQYIVDTYVPWSRVLGDRPTHRHGRKVDLAEYALNKADTLVLKRGMGMQGQQVLLGVECPPNEWAAAVQDAVELGDSIVQEYVEPARCRVAVSFAQDSEIVTDTVAPVLSPFLFGQHPGGVWARFFTNERTGVVSREGHGAMENAVVTLI